MNFFNNFVDKGLLDRLNNVLNSEFGRITYTEAVELLMKHNDKFDYKVSWGCDLQTEHERYLTEEIFKKPVFVTDYPKEIKAFYMKTVWFLELARLSAEASVKMTMTSWLQEWMSWDLRKKITAFTWIFVNTVPPVMQVSDLALSAA